MVAQRHAVRLHRDAVQPLLEHYCSHAGEIYPCGSWRRLKPTLGDLDIVTTSPFVPEELFHTVQAIHMWKGKRIHYLHRINNYPFMVEIVHVPPETLGAQMLRWTGSVEWLFFLRGRAKEMGYTLKNHGLYAGPRLIHAETEQGILDALGVPWTDPWDR